MSNEMSCAIDKNLRAAVAGLEMEISETGSLVQQELHLGSGQA